VIGDGEILAPICGLEEGGSKLQMSGFEFVNMDLLPYCSHEVIAMMKNMGYMPGMGIGKDEKGLDEFPDFKTQLTKEHLGFFEGYDEIKKNLGTLKGNFVKKGGDFPFYGFPKLWVGKENVSGLGDVLQ